MLFDKVHDTQEVFRTILHCMSRPGTIQNIARKGNEAQALEHCDYALFLSAMTLLDAEVGFHIIGNHSERISELFAAHTLSKATDLYRADYVFILQDAQPQLIREAIVQAKKGTLRDPQQSATIIMETEMLSKIPQLTLQGPGISTMENVHITANELWRNERAVANQEYPLGVDMIFIDRQSNLMCLPRTTMLNECEVS